MKNNFENLVEQMKLSINDIKINKELETIRQQMILVGYLDKWAEVERTEEEIENIIKRICIKHDWDVLSNHFLELKLCYYNGSQDFDELIYRYQGKVIDYNPRMDMSGYKLVLGLPDLEEEVKQIIENYPDYDYVMNVYNYKMKQEEQNRLR